MLQTTSQPRYEAQANHQAVTTKIMVLGAHGDVAQKKIDPALSELAKKHGVSFQVLKVDTKPPREIPTYAALEVTQIQITDSLIPELQFEGFLGQEVIVIDATPTRCHLANSQLLSPFVNKILIEKPAAKTVEEINKIAKLRNAIPFCHFLGKQGVQEAIMHAPLLEDVKSIEMVFDETSDCGGREIDPSEVDIGYHLFAILICMYPKSSLEVDACYPRCCPDAFHDLRYMVSTAATIHGTVNQNCGSAATRVPFTLRMAKVAPKKKQMIVVYKTDGSIQKWSLESAPTPYAAHRAIFEKHLFGLPLIDLLPNDHATVVNLCHYAHAIATPVTRYAQHTDPNMPR